MNQSKDFWLVVAPLKKL